MVVSMHEPLYTGSVPRGCTTPDGPSHSFQAVSINLTRDHLDPLVMVLFCESCKQLVEVALERVHLKPEQRGSLASD